jgi:hypothetical protein
VKDWIQPGADQGMSDLPARSIDPSGRPVHRERHVRSRLPIGARYGLTAYRTVERFHFRFRFHVLDGARRAPGRKPTASVTGVQLRLLQ